MLIPLEYINSLPMNKKYDLLRDLTSMIVYESETKKLKWYQTSLFNFLIIVAVAIISHGNPVAIATAMAIMMINMMLLPHIHNKYLRIAIIIAEIIISAGTSSASATSSATVTSDVATTANVSADSTLAAGSATSASSASTIGSSTVVGTSSAGVSAGSSGTVTSGMSVFNTTAQNMSIANSIGASATTSGVSVFNTAAQNAAIEFSSNTMNVLIAGIENFGTNLVNSVNSMSTLEKINTSLNATNKILNVEYQDESEKAVKRVQELNNEVKKTTEEILKFKRDTLRINMMNKTADYDPYNTINDFVPMATGEILYNSPQQLLDSLYNFDSLITNR